MKKLHSLIICLFVLASSEAQQLHIGVFGGLAAYNGDLTDKIFPKKVTNGAIGITANYEFTEQIFFRAGYTYAIVGGADRFSDKPELVARNLAFETQVHEFSLVGEYYLFNLYERKLSPYGFIGLALTKYNPYAFDAAKNKVFLQPLSTEGQGIAGYPTKPYKLTQMAIPFGGGIKYAINDNLRIGLELGMRKLFTDHFDDVSGFYADPNDLLVAKGQLSVDMSYRGDEVVSGSPSYPTKGFERGSPNNKDWYYFTGIHFTFRINGNGGGGGGGGKSKMGCPTNVF
ncbi:MAG: hypothetical protein E6H07_15740 [Bacteroidetes bacterium]|nr:MAG: hypothetical protein E6H07_15740 [Bacteroidota bacterium]